MGAGLFIGRVLGIICAGLVSMGLKVHLNRVPYECPSCWMELSTRKYVRMMREWDQDKDLDKRDFFKLFGILTDADFEKISRTPKNEAEIWKCVHWVVDERFEFSRTLPRVLQIGEKSILIPPDPGHLSIGQNILVRQATEGTKSLEENIAIAAAIYLQPLYDEIKFDADKAKSLEQTILDMPVYLIYPVGFFLLNHAFSYGKRPTNAVSRVISNLITRLNRTRQAWRGSSDLFHTMTWR